MKKIDEVYNSLQKSKFRSSFHLSEKLKQYTKEKGRDTIKRHAYDFIEKRIAKEVIVNDGHQTPMKGHPVFLAQHATACCCRGCMEKWHHIPKNRALTKEEIDYFVALILYWIDQQMKEKY